MGTLQREPFRLFFPLGAFLGGAGVLPWLLFGAGFIPNWPGGYHAVTMAQSFLLSMAVGFLGTMLPRRTGAAPLSIAEIVIAALALVAVPAAALLDRLALAQAAYLVVLGTLAQFALRRMRRSSRPAPPSFLLVPVALLSGVAGAIAIAISTMGGPAWSFAAGRSLVEEGVFLALVLAVAPILTPIICHDAKPEEPTLPRQRRARLLFGAMGALLLGSIALEHAVSQSTGLLVRGALVAITMFVGGAGRLPTARGLHRWLYWIALIVMPAGLLAAGAMPPLRVPFLHLTFIGGFSLLVFAVATHVVLLHTGREAMAFRRPWPLALVAALTLAAAALRASAERIFSTHYFEALLVASALWLIGLAIWATFVVPKILRPVAQPQEG